MNAIARSHLLWPFTLTAILHLCTEYLQHLQCKWLTCLPVTEEFVINMYVRHRFITVETPDSITLGIKEVFFNLPSICTYTNISVKHIHQLMKELFPAEWFPISITVIFFLGGSSFTPTDSATVIKPECKEEYKYRWCISFCRKGGEKKRNVIQ